MVVEQNEIITPNVRPMTYARVGHRILAAFIDKVAISFISGAALPFFLHHHADDQYLLIYIFIIVQAIYMTALTSSSLRGSLGKYFCGIQVVDRNGNRLSVLLAFGREMARLISVVCPLIFDFLMIILTKKNTALHDILARTYVIIDPKLVQPEEESRGGRQ